MLYAKRDLLILAKIVIVTYSKVSQSSERNQQLQFCSVTTLLLQLWSWFVGLLPLSCAEKTLARALIFVRRRSERRQVFWGVTDRIVFGEYWIIRKAFY